MAEGRDTGRVTATPEIPEPTSDDETDGEEVVVEVLVLADELWVTEELWVCVVVGAAVGVGSGVGPLDDELDCGAASGLTPPEPA